MKTVSAAADTPHQPGFSQIMAKAVPTGKGIYFISYVANNKPGRTTRCVEVHAVLYIRHRFPQKRWKPGEKTN